MVVGIADSTEARHLCDVLPTRPSDLHNPGSMRRGLYLPPLVESADEPLVTHGFAWTTRGVFQELQQLVDARHN